MKQSILLAAVLAVFSTSPVFAGGSLFGGSDSDSDDTFSEDGAGAMYGGVSVGQSSDGACEANNTLIDGINATTQSLLGTSVVSNFGCPNTTAWKVYGGYKIAPNLAVEGSYVNFGDAESTATVAALPQSTTTPILSPPPPPPLALVLLALLAPRLPMKSTCSEKWAFWPGKKKTKPAALCWV